MQEYNFLTYFSLDYENCPLIDYFAQILYLSNTHKLHGPWICVFYTWMNSFYSTLLHSIACHQG